MKTIGLLAVAQAQVLNDDSCHSVKWEKEKIAFKVESDGQVFASENLLRRYVERNDELTLEKCMKKCVRLAGCVAFNYIKTDEQDHCDMFGRVNNLVDSATMHNGQRGHFSDTCSEIQNMTDYRQERTISLVFKKKTDMVTDDVRDELTTAVLSANGLDAALNNKWHFDTMHHKNDRDIGFSERFSFSTDEYRKHYYTFCQFDFQLDKIARVKSTHDYTDEISGFFGDEDTFIENLFSFEWPEHLELYDIIAPPGDIEIKTPGNTAGMTGRSKDVKDGQCEVIEGALSCSCSVGLRYDNGQCVDIDECASTADQCYANEECYNYRGSFMCIEYPRHDSFTQAASQRIAVLLARLTETRASFDYGTYLADIVQLMTDLEKQDYSDDQTCVQPINFDATKDANRITRASDLNEWFTTLYKRIYWMFRYCDNNSARKYQKQLKGFARRVQRGQTFSFMTISDADIEQELTSDYNENAYDNYFEERQEKIDDGELVFSSNADQGLDDALSAFEAIDWGIFGDYDYYYDY